MTDSSVHVINTDKVELIGSYLLSDTSSQITSSRQSIFIVRHMKLKIQAVSCSFVSTFPQLSLTFYIKIHIVKYKKPLNLKIDMVPKYTIFPRK